MTLTGIAALRIAATLAHALPGVSIRLRDGQRTLLVVADAADASGQAIGPCAFRMAVARAHEHIKSGARLAFMDLPEGVEPAVDVGVRTGDRALPGGIYRVSVGDRTIHGFATTLPPRRCRRLLDGAVSSEALRLHHDAATEVTLVHTVGESELSAAEHYPLLEDALAACVADELLHDLARTGW